MDRRVLRMAGGVMLGLLAACGGDPPAESNALSTGNLPATTGAAAASDAVAAVPVGTQTAPVKIGFVLIGKPVQGAPASVKLSVEATEALDRLEIAASGEQATVTAESAYVVFAPLRAGEPVEHTLAVVLGDPGIADLTLQVKATTAAGEVQARYAVPVLVSAATGG